jgi:signal transduction histidine kinase
MAGPGRLLTREGIALEAPKGEAGSLGNCPGWANCSVPFDERFGSILDALPFGLFILDAKGSPVYGNVESAKLLGVGPIGDLRPEDFAKAYSAFIAGTDEPYPIDEMPIVKALRGESGCLSDMEIRRLEGSVFLEIEAAPVFGPDGKVLYAVAAFRDVTPTKVMQAELTALVEKLEKRAREQEATLERLRESAAVSDLVADIAAALSEAKADASAARHALSLFLANFSHELRTPLNHIIGFSDLIDQKISRGVTDDIGRHAANIRRSGANLLETLNRIIKFAEMDMGVHDAPDLEIFLVDGLLEELAEWATPIAAERGNSVHLTITEPMGSMRSDSSFVQTALRQVVENACKHSRGGRVEIVGERMGTGVDARMRVSVSDEGPGIDLGLVNALLGGHVSPGDPLVNGGLGVGIPLAKKLLDAIGGSIEVESSLHGSTFVIQLPVMLSLKPRQA